MRATVSPAFPAVNGLITLIGLAGHVSALAVTVANERAIAAKDADNVRIDIMFCSRKSAAKVARRGSAGKAQRVDAPFSRKLGYLAMALGCRRRGAVHCIRSGHSKMSALPPKADIRRARWDVC